MLSSVLISSHRQRELQSRSLITTTQLRRRSFHHTDRAAEASETSKLQSFGVCTAKTSRSFTTQTCIVHFVRRSTAHGAWMKPHMVRTDLMAPTSRLTLKEKMKTRSTIQGMSGRHIMCPRSTPFPSERWVWFDSHVM